MNKKGLIKEILKRDFLLSRISFPQAPVYPIGAI